MKEKAFFLALVFGLIAGNVAAQKTITISGQSPGKTFDGIGIVDGGGATSVLLKDYPEKQRGEILDMLYKPMFGGSISTLLVEIPGDGNSTQGSMPSHSHYRGDYNFQRGYTWWVLQEAKRRNPLLSLDATGWSAPAWVGNFWSQDMANYYVSWLRGLRSVYGIEMDAIGCHNEKGYSYKTSRQYTVPVYEIYTTMGKRRLMKLYQGGPRYTLDGDSKMYINRFPQLANGLYDDYKEVGIAKPQDEGVIVDINSSIEIANAYIYPINKVLAYDEDTRENLQKQRLRFDIISMLPEFMNNDLRDNRNKDLWTGLPIDDNYRYCDDLSLKEGTKFYYLSGLGWSWLNWQGDEINITGRYEFTFRLPPVPKAGTYEIRYAIQSNSDRRSMCQVYFGTDPRNLHAQGIPLDLRMGGKYRHLPSTAGGNMPSIVGWLHDHDDLQDDVDAIAENDKKMRNNGYMKGPAIYAGTPGGSNFARGNEQNIRRIVVREYLYPDKVYYLKFKNVLDDDTKECYMDYFEYCSKEVYDNPMTPEDPW